MIYQWWRLKECLVAQRPIQCAPMSKSVRRSVSKSYILERRKSNWGLKTEKSRSIIRHISLAWFLCPRGMHTIVKLSNYVTLCMSSVSHSASKTSHDLAAWVISPIRIMMSCAEKPHPAIGTISLFSWSLFVTCTFLHVYLPEGQWPNIELYIAPR